MIGKIVEPGSMPGLFFIFDLFRLFYYSLEAKKGTLKMRLNEG
jgi:hypothetical protein